MTSLAEVTGRSGLLTCFRKRVAWRFAQEQGLRQRIVSRERALPAAAPAAAA
jgi:hypothetical protein